MLSMKKIFKKSKNHQLPHNERIASFRLKFVHCKIFDEIKKFQLHNSMICIVVSQTAQFFGFNYRP